MKRPAAQWRLPVSDHVAFFSYRWLAWALAALTLTWPGAATATLPRNAGLLLLLGVINVLVTALAQGYVRLLRQRPLLLLLDLVGGAAVLWLSDSHALPFLPYALGALLLPALAFGWRGALFSALSFIGLDVLGLTLFNPATGAALSSGALIVRVLTPLLTAGAWLVLGRVLVREAGAGAWPRPRVADPPQGVVPRTSSLAERPGAALTSTALKRPLSPSDPAATPGSAASAIATRTAAERHPAPSRRAVYDLSPTPAITLAAALEQLGRSVARQSGLEVHVTCSGPIRPLHAAQQTVLLRTAQEALQNVQQHARAHTALVDLCFEPHTVLLTVQDDGVGLLDGTYERPGLHALRAVRYRLAELDGQLSVVEGATGGVTVRAMLPLDAG